MTQLRADAEENRDRIVTAARTLFAETGLSVGMREVARRADVGPATLYRRFPTKQHLIDGAFAQELEQCRQIVVDACADPDPWRGFSSVIRALTILNSRNRGFVAAFTAQDADGTVRSTIVAHRQKLLPELADLVRRAQAAGVLRADFSMDDLMLLLQAGRGLFSVRPTEQAANRFAEIVLDGLRAR
ncbi:TetR/AcrR family transcriptional regulator [Kribbella sp. NPDC048915]|uniref:TetR/AcrR family transcriptional regulator n=1 Tax=Kribbella sp. NPDC048915 TaxID=3155148 RepID=UPI0033C65FFA